MAAGDDLLLTRAEVAERLHVSVQTVRRLAESGHPDEVQVSAHAVRVRLGSVDRPVRQGLPRRRWVREYQPLSSRGLCHSESRSYPRVPGCSWRPARYPIPTFQPRGPIGA